jgi:hypothetical protein
MLVTMNYADFWRMQMYDNWFEQNKLFAREHFTIRIDYSGWRTVVKVKFRRDEDALAFSLKFGNENGGQ